MSQTEQRNEECVDRRRLPRGGRRSTDRPGRHPHVIIADSFEGARVPSSRYLKASGFLVDEAENGEELLAIVSQRVPQVIVTELDLPQWPAWCLSTWLGLNSLTEHIPIIVTAGDTRGGRPTNAPGTASLLVRPFRLDVMLAQIRTVLRQPSIPSSGRQ